MVRWFCWGLLFRSNASRANDLYLGVKLALTEQKKCLPEMALVLLMTVPSGAWPYTAEES